MRGRTQFAFSPMAKIKVATSVCTVMGSRPAICPKIKNSHLSVTVFLSGCGGRTRTYDLRVMSPTSFQLLYSAILGRTLECLHIVAQVFPFVNPFFSKHILSLFPTFIPKIPRSWHFLRFDRWRNPNIQKQPPVKAAVFQYLLGRCNDIAVCRHTPGGFNCFSRIRLNGAGNDLHLQMVACRR